MWDEKKQKKRRLQNNSQIKNVWITATKQVIEHSEMCSKILGWWVQEYMRLAVHKVTLTAKSLIHLRLKPSGDNYEMSVPGSDSDAG